MALTDTAIKALKPKPTRYKVFDGGGLYLEILPTGSKVWRMKYGWNGKDVRYTLGAYPALSLREARQAHLAAKDLLDAGVNPSEKQKATTRTFKAVALEWIERQAPHWSEIHRETVRYRLNAFAFGVLGEKSITDISAADVLAILRRIEAAGKHDTAYRVKGICSQVFCYAVACGDCASDPCRDLSAALTAHIETPRAALTKPDDVAGLMRSIHEYTGTIVVRAALFFSAYTFGRPGEIRRAEWCDIDLDKLVWIIPPEKMKMRREHRVPLSRQAAAILADLKDMAISDRWVFPSVRPSTPLSENGILSALRRMGYAKEEMTAHGFRSMASTMLNELGWPPDVIEIQLAHVDKNSVRSVYNRAEYWQKRVEMMQAWADYLDALRLGAGEEVGEYRGRSSE